MFGKADGIFSLAMDLRKGPFLPTAGPLSRVVPQRRSVLGYSR